MKTQFNCLVVTLYLIAIITSAAQGMIVQEPVEVQIDFANTLGSPVRIYLFESGQPGTTLDPGGNHSQSAETGSTWAIESDGHKVAEYVTQPIALQQVDLAELVRWQKPVSVVIQNTTSKPVDIVWVKSENEEIAIAEQVAVNCEITSPSMPGHFWIVKQDGKIIAQFVANNEPQQVVDVAILVTWMEPVQLVFQNLTDSQIDIFWVDGDGKESRFTETADGQNLPLPAEKRFKQTAQPTSLWRVRQDGKLVAEYTVDNEPRQIVNITNEVPTRDLSAGYFKPENLPEAYFVLQDIYRFNRGESGVPPEDSDRRNSERVGDKRPLVRQYILIDAGRPNQSARPLDALPPRSQN